MLEDVMTAFYEGKYDVLLSTTIVESGLDIPNANTLIVHRADMFGLAQLYQLRGRVGRAKTRAYALLHDAGAQAPDRGRREAPQGAAVAGHPGRRLLAGEPRPRHPRRRQPAGRRAVGPHPRGGVRALPGDAGGGGGDPQGRRYGRGAGPVERRRSRSAHPCSSPTPTSPTCSCASASTAASPSWRAAPTSTASPPSWWTASASCPRR